MRVYFVGAHSVGKTTLAEYTSKRHELFLIPEVARLLARAHNIEIEEYPSNLEYQDAFQRRVFELQLEAERGLPSFVSDRAFDAIAYSSRSSRVAPEIAEDEAFKDYLESLKDDSQVTVFFVRPSIICVEDDNERASIDEAGIYAIDAIIEYILQSNSIPYIPIEARLLRDRCLIVDAILNLKKEVPHEAWVEDN